MYVPLVLFITMTGSGSLKRTFKSCPDFSGTHLGIDGGVLGRGVARRGIVATAPAVGSAGAAAAAAEGGSGLKRAIGTAKIMGAGGGGGGGGAGGGGGGARGRALVPLAPSATSLGQVGLDTFFFVEDIGCVV